MLLLLLLMLILLLLLLILPYRRCLPGVALVCC